MHVQLSNNKLLNLTFFEDAKQGFHDKKVVVIYLTNGTKFIENFATEKEAEEEVEKIREAAKAGGGLLQKDTLNDFPKTGNPGTIYIAKDTGQTYYWDPVTKTYIKTGTAGRTGVYGYGNDLPDTVGATIIVKKSDLNEILKPSVDFSEGSEVIGDNSVHGIITGVNGDDVTITTITDLTIDSFRQVTDLAHLPTTGVNNILYYVKDLDEFRIWDDVNNKWVEPFHPIIFHDENIANARPDTFYVVGDKIKYTKDGINWIEIGSKHPLSYQDIPVANADIGTIYVIGDKARYTLDNQNWIYLNSDEHSLEFGNVPVANAKLNTIYVDGNKAKYTTDNINWIELDSEHPLEFANPTIANAKTNVLYIDNGKAKYTTDNVNWIELNTEHPIIFGNSPVASAKLNTLYVDGNTIKYTTDNVNWVEISGGASMKEYLSNVDLVTVPLGVSTVNITDLALMLTDKLELEQLVYDNKGTVGRIIKIDNTTGEVKIETMTIAGDVGKKYMPIAPDTKHLIIKQRGTGYAVGDIVESTTTGTFAEVETVDATGAILTIKNSTNTTQNTSGTGAVIDYDQILYAGYGSNWATLGDIDTLAAQIVYENFEYEIGYDYEITAGGTGYTTGDIIETTEAGKFIKVTSVDANGSILTVEFTRDTTQNTSGTGAIITATANPDIFVIPTFYWNSGMGVFSLTNDDGAYVEFFRTGDDLIKYNAAADSKIYKFTFDEVNGIITQEFYKVQGGGSGNANLTEDITSNTTCGAAPANTFFPKGMSFTDFAKTILIKEIAPTITVTATNSGVHLVKDTINGTTITLNINSLGTSIPTSIEFYLDGTLIDTQPYVSGQTNYSTNYATSITSNVPVTNTVIGKLIFNKSDGNASSVQGSKTFVFVYPSYFGTTQLDATTVTDTDIKAMTVLKLTNKSYTATGITMSNERTLFAYPQTYGNLSSIKDANNFEYLQSYDLINVTIDSVQYNVYVLHDSVTVTNFKQIYN